MASSDRAARRKTTGIQQLCQSVGSLQGEKSVGGNPDTEVTGWENPGSGELQTRSRTLAGMTRNSVS